MFLILFFNLTPLAMPTVYVAIITLCNQLHVTSPNFSHSGSIFLRLIILCMYVCIRFSNFQELV